jgi:hypothetical protein
MNNGALVGFGVTKLDQTIAVGGGICSSQQGAVFLEGKEVYSWPRASVAGTNFLHYFDWYNAENLGNFYCAIHALGAHATVTYNYQGTDTVDIESFTTKFISVRVDPYKGFISFSSSAPIIIACYRLDGKEIISRSPLIALSASPQFGFMSTALFSVYGNCEHAPISSVGEPSNCIQSDGVPCPIGLPMEKGSYVHAAPSGIWEKYAGPEIEITSSGTCSASNSWKIQNGNGITIYLTEDRFSKTFVLPSGMSYISVISTAEVSCDVIAANGTIVKTLETTGKMPKLKTGRVSFENPSFGGGSVECNDTAMIIGGATSNGFNLIGEEDNSLWKEFEDSQCPPTPAPSPTNPLVPVPSQGVFLAPSMLCVAMLGFQLLIFGQ